MSPRTATVGGLPMAFALLTAMHSVGAQWGESYRPTRRRNAHTRVAVDTVSLLYRKQVDAVFAPHIDPSPGTPNSISLAAPFSPRAQSSRP